MGHTITGLGTATLDTLGGLITFASARDLPEGASPRNWDVDFSVGSVFTRPGLVSVYTYATTLTITGFSLGSGGLATFTYVGTEPTVNEGFLLSGFSGPLAVLNGQTVFVEAVTMTQFMASVTNGPVGSFTGLDGIAVSTVGLFVGPNTGAIATSTTWNNPQNISSPTAYASASSGIVVAEGPTAPTSVTEYNPGSPWTNAQDLVSPTSFATVSGNSGNSPALFANGTGFTVPDGATITGIVVSGKASYSGAGPSSVTLQLATDGTLVGTPLTFAVSSTYSAFTKGSSLYQWGTTFTPDTVDGNVLGVQIYTTGSGTYNVGSLAVTVYYTTSSTSEVLINQGFSFSVALTNGISGFGVTFRAYSAPSVPGVPTTLTLQLLQAGVPEGTPKQVTLSTVPTTYSLGGPSDGWGYVWSAANVNSTQFGVQITASGSGTSFAGDLDITTYITAALENFNWVGSYEQNDESLNTLALDAAGNLWIENVRSNPGVLSLALTGILPGSFANGATIDDNEFVMFSDLTIGTDRPRQLDANGNWYPVTQVGPGAPPQFQAASGTISGTLSLTSFTWAAPTPPATNGVATFTINPPAATPPAANSLYVLKVAGSALSGQVVTVLSGATTTSFSAEVTGTYPAGPTTISGTATPTFAYDIASITQFPAFAGNLDDEPNLLFLQSSAPGSVTPGTNVTVYYTYATGGPNGNSATGDTNLIATYNAGNGTYVYISGADDIDGADYNGVWQVTSVGIGKVPGFHDETLYYFTFTYLNSAYINDSGEGSSYRITLATMTVDTPIPGLAPGSSVTITGATPSGWNDTWTIVTSNSEDYSITSTGYNYTTSTATFGWGNNPVAPVAGNLITVIGATNNAIFNGTFVIATVAGAFFTVNSIVAPAGILPGQTPETQAQATEFGTVFTFDPGAKYVNTPTDVIYGNDTGTGEVVVIGTSVVPIGAGTRQAICFFITESGTWTPASIPTTFTVASDANLLNFSNLPIGPPDTVARGIAITEAGQNGVPGANFYVIPEPVSVTVNAVVTTYTSTIIQDNITTSGALSFTDQVLLNSEEVDVPGNNLFSLIELGSCAWCLPYASRMFYGLQLNKVQNFNNLSFDGGYLPNSQGTILPLGWGVYPTANEITLLPSPVTGDALYVINNTGVIQAVMGTISQSAYQDYYNVPIIETNTLYSVRVACSCPSGTRLGTLVIDLVNLSSPGVFGNVYGSFSVPFTSMTSLVTVFTGTLLTTIFDTTQGSVTTSVPPLLQLRVREINMGVGADILIERIEVFPTLFPYLKTEVYGSYINEPEEVDASGDGGIIDTSTENAQACMGGFVMRDQMYLLKTGSMYSVRDNPNSEPGGWGLTEISNRVGSVGINSFDSGEEWAITACRNGIYGFDGGKPEIINLETFDLWQVINWDFGYTICLRNDLENRRILAAVPLPTGTSPEGVPTATVTWLPFAPYNPAPITPNVILMLNYQSIGSFADLLTGIGTHSTMFGTLANPDMRRKWTIWQIPTPYMGQVTQANLIDLTLYICNGINSSKIYDLDPNQRSDDGVAIYGLYTTYGHVNAVKAATLPIFGLHTKRYTVLQANIEGAGIAQVRLLPNDLSARYPYVVPGGITLASPENDDFFRPINCKAQRLFLEFSTNAVGSWFNLCKTLLSGKSDPHSPLNPTGGGNVGITTTQV
jgi:hypothetical protein